MAQEGNGDAAVDAATDVRGRASRRINRLEERLGQTRTQLDRAKGRRDELEHLLQRMVDTESSRRDQLKAREAELERRHVEALRVEQDARAKAEERMRETRAELERREQRTSSEIASLRSRIAELESQGEEASHELRGQLSEAQSEATREQRARAELEDQ